MSQPSCYSSALQLKGLVIRGLLLQAGEGGGARRERPHHRRVTAVGAHRLPARPAAAAEAVLHDGRAGRRAVRIIQIIGGRRVQAQDKTGGGSSKRKTRKIQILASIFFLFFFVLENFINSNHFLFLLQKSTQVQSVDLSLVHTRDFAVRSGSLVRL